MVDTMDKKYWDEDLAEAKQDEDELREAFEYEQRGRAPTNPHNA